MKNSIKILFGMGTVVFLGVAGYFLLNKQAHDTESSAIEHYYPDGTKTEKSHEEAPEAKDETVKDDFHELVIVGSDNKPLTWQAIYNKNKGKDFVCNRETKIADTATLKITVYFSGEKIRLHSVPPPESATGEVNTYDVIIGTHVYYDWMTRKGEAVVHKTTDNSDNLLNSINNLLGDEENSEATYPFTQRCSEWKLDTSKFIPPAGATTLEYDFSNR